MATTPPSYESDVNDLSQPRAAASCTKVILETYSVAHDPQAQIALSSICARLQQS